MLDRLSDQSGLDETRREWFFADDGLECAADDCSNKVPCDRAADFNPYCSDECEQGDLSFDSLISDLLDDPEALDEDEDDKDEDDSEPTDLLDQP
jgi:hypothetical protein